MKRKNNLYENIYDFSNMNYVIKEITNNVRNKRKSENLKQDRSYYIANVFLTLTNKKYTPRKYNEFVIYEPKKRNIVSQNLKDKIINHLVARYILYPAILPALLDVNVASRKNMGTSKGLFYFDKYNKICNQKYKTYSYLHRP